MKKVISFCLLYCVTTLAFAQTCPSANELLVQRSDGKYDVVAPPGWTLVVNDKKPAQNKLTFRVAGWGDHKKLTDHIRCHYYHDVVDHVQIQTVDLFDESSVSSRSEWIHQDLYHLCVSQTDEVKGCPFA